MPVQVNGSGSTRKEQAFLGQAREVADNLRGPSTGAGEHGRRRRPNVVPAKHVAGLRLNQRLAIQHAIAVEQLPARLDKVFEAQVERTVEVPEIGALQTVECIDWIAHST